MKRRNHTREKRKFVIPAKAGIQVFNIWKKTGPRLLPGRRQMAFAGMTALFLICTSSAHALKKAGHVKATLVSEVKSIQPGTPFWVAVRLEMQPRWHTYWKNPGESGAPTEIDWTLPHGFKAGPIVWPVPKKIEIPPVVSYGYSEEVLLLVKITPPSVFKDTKPIALKAHVDWLECEVVCIPAQVDVSLTLPVRITPPETDMEWQERFSNARFEWPIASDDWMVHAYRTSDGFRLTVTNNKQRDARLDNLYFFADDPAVVQYAAKQRLGRNGTATTLDLTRSDASTGTITALRGILMTSTGWRGPHSEKGLVINVPVEEHAPETSHTALLTALLFAFVGGLILNLMPCVLPVLSIKILSFVKQAHQEPRVVFLHGLTFSIGVLVSFWTLAGTLIFLRASGQQLGWGFQLQSPSFVVFMAILFFVLALNLFGFFEIGSSLVRLAGLSQGQTGYHGSFLNGVLATIVTTPCTAPFMGSALGYALTQPAWASLLIFTSLGLGMASPYLILSAHPRFLRFVPKPGPWMEKFKKIMGVLFLLTVVWLLWVLNQQVGFYRPRAERSGAADKLAWEPYSPQRVEQLRKSGRIVFVDFTAAWCLTCQVNERVVLRSKTVTDAFRSKNIALIKADWTSHDATITKTLGGFGRSGVPFYVLYPSDPKAAPIFLPELLTTKIVLDSLSNVN